MPLLVLNGVNHEMQNKNDMDCEKNDAKYPATHFLFFKFCELFILFYDKCTADLLSQNNMKCLPNVKNKVYSGVFLVTFFAFRIIFSFAFHVSRHFAPGAAFSRNVKRIS